MTEFQPASHQEFNPAANEMDRKAVIEAYNRIKMIIRLQGNRLEDVLVRGYGLDSTQVDDEFTHSDGTRSYHLGRTEDMIPPELTVDEELRQEKWMANPLKYAAEGGRLGIYLKNKLDKFNQTTDLGDGYGTVIVDATAEQLESARIQGSSGEITVVANPRIVKLSQEDYELIVRGQGDVPVNAAKELGIEIDSGDVKLVVESGKDKGIKYISTQKNDFALGLQHVVEISTVSEQTEQNDYTPRQLTETGLEPMEKGTAEDVEAATRRFYYEIDGLSRNFLEESALAYEKVTQLERQFKVMQREFNDLYEGIIRGVRPVNAVQEIALLIDQVQDIRREAVSSLSAISTSVTMAGGMEQSSTQYVRDMKDDDTAVAQLVVGESGELLSASLRAKNSNHDIIATTNGLLARLEDALRESLALRETEDIARLQDTLSYNVQFLVSIDGQIHAAVGDIEYVDSKIRIFRRNLEAELSDIS